MTDALLRRGTPGRPALVIAGSLASDERAWERQFDTFGASRDIWFYRWPGHGGRAPARLQSLDALARDLLAALAAAGVEGFDFVGLSLGAMVGLEMAGARNERLQRLAACCCRFHQTPELARQWDARIAAVQHDGMGAIAEPTLERWLTPAFRQRHPETADAVLAMILSTHPEGYADAAAAVRDGDLRRRLPPFGERALVLSGSHDQAAPADHMAALAQALGAHHVVLPDCAHLCGVEQPQAFDDALADWLR